MKKFIMLAGFIILATIFGFSLVSCSRGFHRWQAKRTGDIGEAYKVQDADKRLADLHWFEEQYQVIQSAKIKYNNAVPEDKSSLRNILNDYIGQYNSRMRQYDRAMWANSDLPERLDMVE